MSIDFEVAGKLMRTTQPSIAPRARHPLRPGVPRSSGINGAKSCILGLSCHLISLLKLHFFVLFFSYFQQLFKIKDPFLHLFLLGAAIACLIRVLLYRRNVYNSYKKKNREYVTRIIQSLSVYDFISDKQKITTDISVLARI